jgi:hypothetical protein
MKTFSAISGLAAVGIAAITYVRAQATVQSPANLIECQVSVGYQQTARWSFLACWSHRGKHMLTL